jgi:hypothetical protein
MQGCLQNYCFHTDLSGVVIFRLGGKQMKMASIPKVFCNIRMFPVSLNCRICEQCVTLSSCPHHHLSVTLNVVHVLHLVAMGFFCSYMLHIHIVYWDFFPRSKHGQMVKLICLDWLLRLSLNTVLVSCFPFTFGCVLVQG